MEISYPKYKSNKKTYNIYMLICNNDNNNKNFSIYRKRKINPICL